jgi:hypothetical protein
MDIKSPCIICGQTRIVEKTWTETVNNAKVTYTRTVCPDKECQKKVDEQLKNKQEKINLIRKASDKRKMENQRNRKKGKKISK